MNSSLHLLLVDDDSLIADSLRLLIPSPWQITHRSNPQDLPQEGFYHAAFVDMHFTKDLQKAEGPLVIEELKKRFPSTEVVAISGDLNMNLMERCLARGASKFVAKPLMADEVKATLEKIEALWMLKQVEQRPAQNKVQWIGHSAVSQKLKSEVARLRGERGAVLIEGETGTGKEVVAGLLRQQDPGRPFLAVHVGAIPENLFESEFFGHVKGAFTGADTMKIGLAEAAQGGDLFLDEIEALPLTQQVKLLRFLETGEVRKVGAKEPVISRVRVLAATNQNLSQLVKEGKFREDLLYRLQAHHIVLPPLRDRRDDIDELAKFFLSQERPRSNKIFTPEAIAALKNYSWPGNVRELKRICEQLSLTSPLPMIRAQDVEKLLSDREVSQAPIWDGKTSLGDLVAAFEAQMIRQCLSHVNSVDEAAEKLQVSRSSLYKKIKDYGIEVES